MADQWANFAVLVGGASAALTGLLFVAVSLNLDRIMESALLRAAAAQTLVVLVSPLLISIPIVIPGQTIQLLGLELTAIGILVGLVSLVLQTQNGSEEERRRVRLYRRVAPNLITTLLILATGVSLVAGRGGGLYWAVPAVLVALIGGVTNAWLIMVRLRREPATSASRLK